MDEITGHEDFINARDVRERIAEIEAADCDGDREGADGCENAGTCPSCYGEAGEELAALRELEEDFRNYSHDSGSAIRDSYMTDYAMEYGDDIAGVGQDSFLFSYVNWGGLAESLKQDMAQVTFRDGTYYITP
jgi:hypothetical protein